jgi:hypothetical protein
MRKGNIMRPVNITLHLTLSLTLTALIATSAHAQITTSQYNNARTGANLNESILTPQNVSANQFGKLFTLRADGDIYAQPLYLPNLQIPGKGAHNVLFIATERDNVYAFDADGKSPDPLWRVTFTDPAKGIDVLTTQDVACPFITPVVGITSTPVIDAATGTLYVLARTKEQGRYVQRLHALDVATGAEKFGGPITIQASTKTSKGRQLDFDPLRENPRASLLLVNGKLYLMWASSCDVGPYHGWVMVYDARTLAQIAVFNDSPDGSEGGIWAADTGPAADSDGNVFVATGNGTFDAGNAGGRDYGDTLLKLTLSGQSLNVTDYFTPFNQEKLNDADLDLGSGGPILLPDQPGPHPHLVIVAGKGGTIYVVDRDNMGRFHTGDDSHAVQTITKMESALSAPAYWNQNVYILVSNDVLKDFALKDGRLSPQPVAQANEKFVDPGATPAVSANGTKNGIVWVIQTKGWRSSDRFAVLRAYDAANVSHELFNSETNAARDRAGACLRFTIPTVVNGRVYIGTKSEVDVYGLLPTAGKTK